MSKAQSSTADGGRGALKVQFDDHFETDSKPDGGGFQIYSGDCRF